MDLFIGLCKAITTYVYSAGMSWHQGKKAMQRGLGGFPHERLHQDKVPSMINLWSRSTTIMISDWLEENHEEIQKGKIRVFSLDECHVCAGDICGYGWGDRKERREVDKRKLS
ncbi:hypothetical protein [Moorena sp. SIO3B2]|uniref:hypothetical protein n=2 Tax=unclassified Moorena TaxID=2683338 RepID=UPI00257A21F3|nr:hypothetical protein [Moorena sp. SIO3B2]